MANEILLTALLSASQNGNTVSGSLSARANAQSAGFMASEQSIPTGGGTLDLGDITNPQAVFVKNLDPENFVQLDANGSFNGFPQKLLPGQGVLLLPETGTIHAKADTAAVLLWVVAV